jgi:hypothetical protein
MDKTMLEMDKTQLTSWNKEVLLEYLFNGNLNDAIAIIQNNTMRWRYARCQEEFGKLARDVYGDKVQVTGLMTPKIRIAGAIERS